MMQTFDTKPKTTNNPVRKNSLALWPPLTVTSLRQDTPRFGIQTKLGVNKPGDQYEHQADRVADQVMRMPATETHDQSGVMNAQQPNIQRMCAGCEDELQTKERAGATPHVTPEVASGIQSIRGGGQALSESSRSFFESRFGKNFSDVRIHSDTHADQLARNVNARAFTLGRDVVFSQGQYQPGTHEGRRLMAHELTHVLQQGHSNGQVHIQRVEWGEGEVPPMPANEFREYLLNQTVHLISQHEPALAESMRRILEGDDAIPALTTMLDDMVRRSVGLRHAQQLDFATASAQELINNFILDPNTSVLDLLPQRQRTRFRNFNWHENDYLGGAAGPNEGRTRSMLRALNAIRPQRRANSTANAVVSETEYTNQVHEHIRDNLVEVPDFPEIEGRPQYTQRAGESLYRTAQASFLEMREAARADGVPLIIRDAHRPLAVAQARALAVDNANAVASFSSHTLGLAVDLNMSMRYEDPGGRQQNLRYQETTTTPMQNVVDMRESPVHKWIFLHGAQYGWYPFQQEPWHWEYNPEGFRDTFRAAVTAS